MHKEQTQRPLTFDISRLPQDFSTGRYKNMYLLFDNLEGHFLPMRDDHFPVKCESLFIMTVVAGSMSVIVNMHKEEVHAGQALVMMPGCIFQGQATTEDFQFFSYIMNDEMVEDISKSLGVHIDLTHRYYNYHIQDVGYDAVKNELLMYETIKNELATPDYKYKKEVIQRYCEIGILKQFSAAPSDQRPELKKPLNRKEQIFHDFLTLLEQYFTQERSISFYANRMCLTPKYLSTIVKEVSGKHGMQWIDEYVILEAKALLRDGTLNVKQVSDELNFPSQSMFGRFFKKMTGYSPKQYKLL